MPEPARTADVVVVGAGIVGAACAYRLIEKGLRVVLLEQDGAPAGGSTGKSAAGVRAQFANATNIRLSQASIAEYAGMADGGYRPMGYLMIVPERRWAEHFAGAELQRSLGVPVEVLGAQEAQGVLRFDTDGVGGCTLCPTDGVVDPHGITLNYLRRARDRGLELLTRTAFTSAARGGGTWQVETTAGRIEAAAIVNAAGCWGGRVAAAAGLDVPVKPARRNVFVTAASGTTGTVPVTFDLDSGVWLRSEGDRVIIGLANPDDTGWSDGVDWDWLEPTMHAASARFPWLADLALDTRASWWGYYELTPDEFPVLGAMPGAEGWVNACGFSGHGVMQAAATGRVIAQEVVGETTFVDIDPLRIERFADPGHAQHDITV